MSAIPWFGTVAGTVYRTHPFHVTADLLPVDATDLYFLENGIVVFTPIERFPSPDAVLNPSRVRASSSLPLVVPIVEPAQNLGETFRHPFSDHVVVHQAQVPADCPHHGGSERGRGVCSYFSLLIAISNALSVLARSAAHVTAAVLD